MKKTFAVIIVLILATFFIRRAYLNSVKPVEVDVSDAVEQIIEDKEVEQNDENGKDEPEPETDQRNEAEEKEDSGDSLTIPAKVQLDIPFIVQAPFANWDLPYKEACEEASIMMAHSHIRGDKKLTEQQMKDYIDEIIPWGLDTFGTFDSSAENSARYLTEYLGYEEDRVSVIYDMTINDIKAVLARGYPVIVPAAGRELGNRFFRAPGPLYHMLVITGYDSDEFITNDPGTKRGEGYRYDQQVLYNAIHDLTDDLENIGSGRKVMIVVK